MGKVYRALQRAEEELRAYKPDDITDTDKLDQPIAAGFHRPDDPISLREYERLATEIRRLQSEGSIKTMMLASCQHGEGSTTVAANLAFTLAEGGKGPVLLVDANFRRPVLRQVFHTEQLVGLTELVSKEATWEGAVKETATSNLYLLTAGKPPSTPTQLFEQNRFTDLVEEFRSEFDLTIFDAPPLLAYADALPLAAKVDRVILVAQAERTRGDLLERAKNELEKSGARIFGVVLNRKKSYGPRWLQRYFDL